MNHVAKNYTIGDLFLAEPYLHFVHRLPLLTFGDMMGSVELDLEYHPKHSPKFLLITCQKVLLEVP